MTFESFEYKVPEFSTSPMSILELVLKQSSSSLVHLSLPAGIISSSTLASLPWPRLRELDSRTTVTSEEAQSILPPCCPECRFCALCVLLPQGPNSHGLSLWRVQRGSPFPCQEFESMTVSYPDPQDSAYSQPPATLRRLALRHTPRHYRYRFEQKTIDYLSLRFAILTASEVFLILCQHRSEQLQELELEYEEDGCDNELLTGISAYSAALTILTLYRYRRRDSTMGGSAADMAQALTPLRRHRILRLHLDFVNAPHLLTCYMVDIPPGTWDTFFNTFTSTACVFAAHPVFWSSFVCCSERGAPINGYHARSFMGSRKGHQFNSMNP
ncbi:hypothetical protein GY45DRAFT_1078933 [Cubamyces sp. BRFM 1775]|nr:hypothetical protein GY45DRAFT_1078933 [Cubamyces sp. BRFM 1775]